MAILYAFGNLLCATFSDLGFKFYTRNHREIGAFVLIIGLVWTGFCLGLAQISNGLILDTVTLFWGSLVGILGVVANAHYNSVHRAYQPLSLDQYAELERMRRAGVRTPAAPPQALEEQ